MHRVRRGSLNLRTSLSKPENSWNLIVGYGKSLKLCLVDNSYCRYQSKDSARQRRN